MTHKEQYRESFEKEVHKQIRETMRELNTLMIILETLDKSFEEWYIQKFPNEK